MRSKISPRISFRNDGLFDTSAAAAAAAGFPLLVRLVVVVVAVVVAAVEIVAVHWLRH